jgi:hypothetical protein
VLLPPSAALGRGLTDLRRDQAALLEPLEGGVQRAGRNIAPGALLDLAPYSEPIGIGPEPQQCQQDQLLEAPQ